MILIQFNMKTNAYFTIDLSEYNNEVNNLDFFIISLR